MLPESGSIRLPVGDAVPFVLHRSARRTKSVSMRVHEDGSLIVRAPMASRTADVLAILAGRARWIAHQRALVAQAPPRTPPAELATLPYLGRQAPVVNGLPSVDGPAPPDFRDADGRGLDEARLAAWYRRAAEHYLPPRVAALAPLAGAVPAAVVVSRQRRAWGSCSSAGVIRLSWRLMMLRPELIDAVIVHELCHLLHHNHGKQFWSEVGRVQPDFRSFRAELRTTGRRLPF